MNKKYILIIIALIIVIGGGILTWQSFKISKEKVKIPVGTTSKEIIGNIGPSAVWNIDKCWPECLTKWHSCKNLDCISDVMKQYGASLDARNFTTKILLENGFLSDFQEMGKIDLGIVAFPDRANVNTAYYLLNGSPLVVSTEISQEQIKLDLNGDKELENGIKQDILYSQMKAKYPNIWFLGYDPQFIEKKILPDNNERFIFAYKFLNGCRACNTEYSAKIGFDFDSSGKFLRTIFLQIVKE